MSIAYFATFSRPYFFTSSVVLGTFHQISKERHINTLERPVIHTGSEQRIFILLKLATTASNVDLSLVLATGASQLRSVFTAKEMHGILIAYMYGLKVAFALAIAAVGLPFLSYPFPHTEKKIPLLPLRQMFILMHRRLRRFKEKHKEYCMTR